MSVRVRIPSPLRSLTEGEGEVEAEGASVREMITDLEAKYPGIQERLCDANGDVRRFVNIFVGQEDIRFLGGLDTLIEEGAEVSIIPAIAGGA
ncbi:MAG: MoaD/ThiS family protein [Actinomycetota bacterium]|nr:MoaD/ThiS family protein [Actinomycetota bacterium]